MHVVVCRWSDGSYLEDQDHWWMAGIHRSVEIMRRNKRADIVDFRVQGDMNGHLGIYIDLRKAHPMIHGDSKIKVALSYDEQIPIQGNRKFKLTLYDDKQTSWDGEYNLGTNNGLELNGRSQFFDSII